MHHLELDHIGIESELLQEATLARETKKQLGNYLDISKKGAGLECPLCFEIFKDIDEISKHGKIEHNRVFDPKFLEKMERLSGPFLAPSQRTGAGYAERVCLRRRPRAAF